MFTYLFLAFQLVPMPKDPIRAAEIQQRALADSARQQERGVQAKQEFHQRQVELKFNQLVEAVASFARRYNETKGQAWPLREAEKLRQAMRELQAVEKSLQSPIPLPDPQACTGSRESAQAAPAKPQ